MWFDKTSTPSYEIISDIIRYSILKRLRSDERPIKEQMIENYSLGYISLSFENEDDIENPEKFLNQDIVGMEVKDDYFIIKFLFVSMMVSPDYEEDFLCQKLAETRKGFLWFGDYRSLSFLKDKGLGLRIMTSAGIGGENYLARSATVFTPEEIQKMFE